jgi:mannose-6-phosphate isomerase-like protein (cupin superfamily)
MGMIKTAYSDLPAYYTTKDGSLIRELMHPAVHGGHNQSLAEAIVPAHTTTHLHCHVKTEEIYHITGGKGEMTLGNDRFAVSAGDTILIPPGTPHRIANTQAGPLKLLCCCCPPYSHEDTLLLPATDLEGPPG